MKTHFYLYLILALLLFFAACSNPQKMIYQGRYDEVIAKLTKKMKKSLKRKPADVTALETAFNKANTRDFSAIDAWKAENNESHWAKINETYSRIKARQEKISPLMPIKDDNGRVANIVFVNTDQNIAEAKQKAAEYSYNRGVTFLNEARQQNRRPRAREAYVEFLAAETQIPNYKETQKLKEEAKVFGTVRILAVLSDQSNSAINYSKNAVADSLFILYKSDEWTKTDYIAKSNIVYNYEISFIIRQLSLSDVASKDNSKQRSMVVDTTINGVKQKVTVNATAIQRVQRQNVQMDGLWQIVDKSNGQLICDNNIQKSFLHIHNSLTYTGDVRALTQEDLAQSRNSPNFPNRDQMLQIAAKEVQKTVLQQCNWAKP